MSDDVLVVIKKPGYPLSMGDEKYVSAEEAAEIVKKGLGVHKGHTLAELPHTAAPVDGSVDATMQEPDTFHVPEIHVDEDEK